MQLSVAIRQRIINLARNNKISLKSLSVKSGISYSTIISFMNGKTRTLTLSTLYEICLGLNIEFVDFFDDALFNDAFDEHEKHR